MQISKIDLINKLQFISDFLRPHTQRAYLVGGSVRDYFLGLELRDFDIEVYDISPEKFDLLMQKLGANGYGKSFFVYKFQNYDLALARTENKSAPGHKGFEVQICNDEALAAKRRDFTLNALMINIFSGELLDFYGGFEDLKGGILRYIDDKSFMEDSLRVLRAVGFVSRFKFYLAPQSLNLMKTMDISDLSEDRINAELYKFFKGEHLALAYKALQDLGLEKQLFGVEFDDDNFLKLLKNARKFVKDEALFLYLYLNYFNIKEPFCKKSKLKKTLLSKVSQPFFKKEVSDLELLKISSLMPLKSWLGLWDQKRIERAKFLGVYDEKFHSQIQAKTYLKQGFFGKMLGLKLESEKEKEMMAYLEGLKCTMS
ncbi:CCA tRNA nucleotidyltransferase [Campylobacter upsaliensis]|nr:CCA tRNA nucleotidyltransferase [Campylobacter upsaliensis]EAI0686981.1 CCA tRNA nucleotidyltransferase [Campylobacter upsaliensis]EAI2044748.1 CCA tRNA nucleotidyltransferase [Campylobacter upsaliensis]EAI2444982.1 CCA tRNA nucleotidyltransferase [Campylobacter upsaliensis]EAM0277161.1 CCA tRNA nucleotidyltransferase [Campylobacter upsaliensis]